MMKSYRRDVLETLQTALPLNEYNVFYSWLANFYPFQQDWLLDPHRFAVCNKSRQIGFSHTTAAWAVYRAAFLGETTTIISIGERESTEVVEKAQKHANVLAALGSRWAEYEASKTQIRFTNGGRILGLPASTGGRSYSGNVVLDEFAYHGAKSDKVWDGASAVATHGYCIRVLSTPNGVGNAFHHLWTNESAHQGYSMHQVTVHQAIEDGMNIDIADCWKMAKHDPRVFGQLFECKFLDGEEQYIPTASIQQACLSKEQFAKEVLSMPAQCRTYAGLDVGLVNDLSCLVVLRQNVDNTVYVVDLQTWKRTEWQEQMNKIEFSFKQWGWDKLCVDSTGLGSVPAQLLQSKFGRFKVEPVAFTNASKEEMATSMYQAFADKMIRMPNDPLLMDEICSIKRTITYSGQVRYDAEHTSRGHADRAWALALAIHACSHKPCRRIELPSRISF